MEIVLDTSMCKQFATFTKQTRIHLYYGCRFYRLMKSVKLEKAPDLT
jgi:hypothetical protein